MAHLTSLVSYSDDSDEEDVACLTDVKSKTPFAVLHELEDEIEETEEPDRVRTFPHERGVWASYIYTTVPNHDELRELSVKLMSILGQHITYKFHSTPDLHISLSRTLKLRHHWLSDIHRSLNAICSNHKRFYASLNSVKVFTNDEKTRTFISVEVASSWNKFLRLADDINSILAEYRLPKFYENPSFHVSLCWCLHDARSLISDDVLSQLQDATDEFFEGNSECCLFSVQSIYLKAGEKLYSLPLSAD